MSIQDIQKIIKDNEIKVRFVEGRLVGACKWGSNDIGRKWYVAVVVDGHGSALTTSYSPGVGQRPSGDWLLYCVARDIESVYQGTTFLTFADFAYELGYDVDSLKDMATYEACVKTAKDALSVLGDELVSELIDASADV